MTPPGGSSQMIDVSAAQGGSIDWVAVAASGVTLVAVEAGIGNDTHNSLDVLQALGARRAGLRVTSYAFGYALPTDGVHPDRDPVQQAGLHCSLAAVLGLTEPPILDLEFPQLEELSRWQSNASLVRSWALAYLAETERITGHVPWLYGSYSYLIGLGCGQDPSFARYPLWVAAWHEGEDTSTPPPWSEWTAWQWNNKGSVPGIKGDVDLSWVRQ